MKKLIVGLGAGGHCAVMIELLRMSADFQIVGLVDRDPNRKGKEILGVPIVGDDRFVDELVARGATHFFVGVGGAADTEDRRRLFGWGCARGLVAVNLVHPHATLSPSAHFGLGLAVAAGAILGTRSRLGENVLLNTGSIVDHDCVIADHVHVATGARVCGGVRIGGGAHIGAGSVIREGITIGERAIVGAGAVVIRPVEEGTTVVGVPAVPIKRALSERESA